MSHRFKSAGKQVIYNDQLAFNWLIGSALIENSDVTLTDKEIESVLRPHSEFDYPDFIQVTFRDIFFPGRRKCVVGSDGL